MRKKYLSKTYLRDVSSYEVNFIIDNEKDYYVTVKKMKKARPFVAFEGVHLIDNGTFMVEITPKNENYNMRVYLSPEKEVLEYYFDISKQNGIDEDCKIPFYDDLFTDVIVTCDGVIRIDDENELLEAYQNGEITKEDFNLANETTKKLVAELENGTNRFKNMDLTQFLG